MEKKILSLEQLIEKVKLFKSQGKKIVHCHGVFDLLHIGHIKHFKNAKKNGDILIVTITSDKFVNKGPSRPVFNEKLRQEALAALADIDYVSLNTDSNAIQLLRKLQPDFYCKGPDYKDSKNDVTQQIKKEMLEVEKYRGKVIFTKDISFSSSKLLNQFGGLYTGINNTLIKNIKKEFNFSQVRKLIDNLANIKVLIIGEVIIDQYVFCEALGKSGKEPMLVLRDIKSEEYLGGAAAIANNVAQFSNKIVLFGQIGKKEDFLKKIEKNLSKKIFLKVFKKNNAPTILKKRFLDIGTNNKVLGVYKINDEILEKEDEIRFNKNLKKLLPNYDLVIVSDYGHGFISKKNAELICIKSKYLALNAQVNAANAGYHSMRNYKNIDCVIVNEKEIRYELRDRTSDIKKLIKILSYQQKIKNLIVTRGTEGSMLYESEKNIFTYCGAFAKNTVDKVGAGDAMLSVLSLCLFSKFEKKLSLLIASLAAAQAVETIGNKYPVDKLKILKTLESILK